jgi:RNA polymerase sigma factor (sigma-70 family)
VGDAIADPAAEGDYEAVLDRIELGEARNLADDLDERSRNVLRAHYGLGRPARTLTEIGADLGVTAERARQIEVDALRQLRERLRREELALAG